MRPLRWWAESAPPGGDRVKVSENLGATSVAPVAPVDTSLNGKAGKTAVLPNFSDMLTLSQWGRGRLCPTK